MLALLVPGVGMGAGGESQTGFGRLEYTMPNIRLEHAVSDERLEFTLANDRPEFGGEET